MEPNQITKQMLNFNKTVFDNTYAGVTVMQNISENMMDGFLRQFPWMTEENKKPMKESFQYFRQMSDSCKEQVDKSFSSFSEMVDKKSE